MSKSSTSPASIAAGAPVEFLGMQGRYLIDPANTADQLLGDANSLLRTGLGVLSAMSETLGNTPGGEGFWCAVYALRQASACLDAAVSMPETQGGQ